MTEDEKRLAGILVAAHMAAKNAQKGMVEGRGLDCGFAWVTIGGNTPLARFCRKQNKAREAKGERHDSFFGRKGYPTGWTFWKPGGYPGQSIGIHEAGANAFRDVLAANNIVADTGTRYD